MLALVIVALMTQQDHLSTKPGQLQGKRLSVWRVRPAENTAMMVGMNTRVPPSLEELRRLAPTLQSLAAAHGGRELRVFGSVARGGAQQTSDLDLLVDFPASPSLEQFMDLKLALEDLLNVRVDLVTRNGLRAELRERIEREAVSLA